METYTEVIEPEMGPGLVAHIAIVVARDGDERVLQRMDRRLVVDESELSLATVEIRAQNLEDLAVRLGEYSVAAVTAIGDPGHGNTRVAVDSAIRSGIGRARARRGEFYDPDAE